MMIFVVLLTGFCQLALNAKALYWIYKCSFNGFSYLRFITVLHSYILLIRTAVL